MPPQAPWSPTAHAFAHHQFSHVANFWKQGRQASFRLEALPGGQAELNLTFRLPSACQVIPPPSHVSSVPAPQRPIHPLFPKGCSLQRSGPEFASQKKVSSRQRKSYRRSVLHRAALAAPSLPPPKDGSLRQAAQACVQRLQHVPALPVITGSEKKRPLPAFPSGHSPSLLPLAQRIRTDIQVGESESPEREILRSTPCPENSPSPISPCAKGLPSPAPLVFTPVKPSCLNCKAEMTPKHQCEAKCDVSVEKSTAILISGEAPAHAHVPLPLCHYCCHKGSGQNPVHYSEQCLCTDKVCSCQCYCTDEQLKLKLQLYPSGSSVIVCVDVKDRPIAKEVAEKRITQWPMWPCTSEYCGKPAHRPCVPTASQDQK